MDPVTPELDAGRFMLTLRMHHSPGVHVACVFEIIETARAQSMFASLGVPGETAIDEVQARGPSAVDRYVAERYHRLDFQIATLSPARPWDVSRDN